jgi:hypothetical protein
MILRWHLKRRISQQYFTIKICHPLKILVPLIGVVMLCEAEHVGLFLWLVDPEIIRDSSLRPE